MSLSSSKEKEYPCGTPFLRRFGLQKRAEVSLEDGR